MPIKNTLYSDVQLVECQASPKIKINKDQSVVTILLIDDDLNCVESTKLMLHVFCCEIVTMSNAEDALNYLYKFSKNVVLILLDVDLPGMTGLKFLHRIKRNILLENIPVILQTGCGIIDRKKGLELGAADFLCKPYTKTELYEAINQISFYYKGTLRRLNDQLLK